MSKEEKVCDRQNNSNTITLLQCLHLKHYPTMQNVHVHVMKNSECLTIMFFINKLNKSMSGPALHCNWSIFTEENAMKNEKKSVEDGYVSDLTPWLASTFGNTCNFSQEFHFQFRVVFLFIAQSVTLFLLFLGKIELGNRIMTNLTM